VRKNVSRSLLCPFHVVGAGLAPDGMLDDDLQDVPEAQLLQRPVQPAGRDAEVGLVRGHVMDTMVAPRQYHVVLLQPHHPPGQPEIGVRPFVDLKRAQYAL
jgi:hypothetical protein